MEAPQLTEAGGKAAGGASAAAVRRDGTGPSAPGHGELVPGVVFVGASDALARVTCLVDSLVAELNDLSLAGAGREGLRSLVATLGRMRSGADAAEARAVTALERLDDGGVDAVEVLRRNAGSSQREAQRRKRRAEALDSMPNVAGALAAGDISVEHAEALARAAAATSSAAVDGDAELLAEVAGVPADRAGRRIQTWIQRNQDPLDLHEQHLRQRRRRRLNFGDGDDGMLMAHAAFDRVLGAQFRSLINGIADRIWRAEGGRDNPNSRSAEQRRLDALAIAVGLEAEPSAPPATPPAAAPGSRGGLEPQPRTAAPRPQGENGRQPPTAAPRPHSKPEPQPPTAAPRPHSNNGRQPATMAGGNRAWPTPDGDRSPAQPPTAGRGQTAEPRTAANRSAEQPTTPADGHEAQRHQQPAQPRPRQPVPTRPQQPPPPHDQQPGPPGRREPAPRRQAVPPRHQIVIVASADVVSGEDPQGRCEIPGVGPIPQSELERLACDAELFGVLFSGEGEPLWHGRGERSATDAQRRALIARDGACVLCAEEPARCEAHHVVPWAKPGEGPTDIDNLALLCGTCHRRLHNHKRVLTRSPDGTWGTAPDPRHVTGGRQRAGRRSTDVRPAPRTRAAPRRVSPAGASGG